MVSTLWLQRYAPSPVADRLISFCSTTSDLTKGESGLVNTDKIFTNFPITHDAHVSHQNLDPELGVNALNRADIDVPPSGGFLYMTDEHGSKSTLGISMFHQLHCLDMIKNMLLDTNMHSSSHHNFTVKDEHANTFVVEEETEEHHWMHCFGYLAQGIACAADDTVERPVMRRDETTGVTQFLITGLGETHQCRNIAHIRDAALNSREKPYLIKSSASIMTLRDLPRWEA